MNPPGLRDFLGCDYDVQPLKSMGLRARNALKPWLIRQPPRAMSHRVTARDGRRFKLVHFRRASAGRRQQVERRLRALASHPAVPRLVWSNERDLLVEWADGRTPDPDDPRFALRLGEAFAELYRVDYLERDRDEIVAEFAGYAGELSAADRAPSGAGERLAARLEAALPERVPTGMLCGDQTLANFVIDDEGALSMIDPGSFQDGLPIDIFLIDGLYDRIDRDAFHDGYGAAGGTDFPFLHREALQWMQWVRQYCLQQRLLERTSSLEPRRRRQLARRIEASASRVRSLLG